jgi:hypothetical protein
MATAPELNNKVSAVSAAKPEAMTSESGRAMPDIALDEAALAAVADGKGYNLPASSVECAFEAALPLH